MTVNKEKKESEVIAEDDSSTEEETEGRHIELVINDDTSVKEKFGGLRFYVEGGDEYIQGLIAMSEAYSYHL